MVAVLMVLDGVVDRVDMVLGDVVDEVTGGIIDVEAVVLVPVGVVDRVDVTLDDCELAVVVVLPPPCPGAVG